MPSVPKGLLGVLVVAATLALLGLIVALVAEAIGKRWAGVGWAAAPLLLGAATMLLGHQHPGWHAVAAFLTAGLTGRNAWVFEKTARWASVVAVVGWVVALVCARLIFGGAG